jgi:hypothetical protein
VIESLLGQDRFLPNPFQYITDHEPITFCDPANVAKLPVTSGITFSMLLLRSHSALNSVCSYWDHIVHYIQYAPTEIT